MQGEHTLINFIEKEHGMKEIQGLKVAAINCNMGNSN